MEVHRESYAFLSKCFLDTDDIVLLLWHRITHNLITE